MNQTLRGNPAPEIGSRISRVAVVRAAKLAALASLVAGVWWASHELYRIFDVPVAVIGVDGELKRVRAQELETVVASNLGGGFLSLNLAGICAALEDHPWIATATARRKWPNEVVIAVEEEVPIARWGTDQFLNNKGQVLDIAGAELTEALPLLVGPESLERRVMQQYKNFTQVLEPLDLTIKSCHLAPRGNWLVSFDNGMELAVGKEPVGDKLNRFLRVWEAELKPRADQIARVDIRYANGVAVKWKENAETADKNDSGK